MKEFYKKIQTVEARPLLKKSFEYIDRLEKNLPAYDLGCGVGQDTYALVDKGFSVKAVDISPDAFDYMKRKFGENVKVETIVSSLEDLQIDTASLINASLVLPFVKHDQFDNVMSNIRSSLANNGIFVGNFFGPKDDWSKRLVSKSSDEVKNLFTDFEVVHFDEFEMDKPSANGPEKHWHIIEIIARKVN